MPSYFNAKGNVIAVVSLIAITLTVIMATMWFARNFSTDKLVVEKSENDLANIRRMVDDSCELFYYKADYNPGTETGSLDINSTDICINSSGLIRCKKPICRLTAYPKTYSIDLSKITSIFVVKQDETIRIYADKEIKEQEAAQPPVLSDGQPGGILPPGTTSTQISLNTNEKASCRYSTTPNTQYPSMQDTFITTGDTIHSSQVVGLVDGNTYNYYARCNDVNGNYNNEDYAIIFTISAS